MSRSGFFSRLLGHSEQPATAIAQRPFRLNHSGFSKVVGESHYQDALARTAGVARIELDDEGDERLCFDALLVREPTNVYDARAVAVYSPAGIIGYTPRGSEWCDLLDLLATQGYDAASCRANLCGGDGGKSWGVVLHARPEIEAERLADRKR